jgi:hypothetical protein
MKRSNLPLSAAECAKQLGISQEQFEAQAKKQVDEYFQKKYPGMLSLELKPHEKLELEKQAKTSSSNLETFMKDTHRRCGVPVPFPLEDIFYYTADGTVPPDGVYDHDDPEYLEKLSIAAYGAINDYRMFWYKPGLNCNKEQLKIATEVALDIRAVYHDLQNIPLAENPDCPTDEDFIRLGQWFLDANTVIKAQIARETAKEKLLNASDEKPLEGEWSKAMQKKDMMQKLGFGLRGYRKLNTFTKEYPIRNIAGNRQLFQLRIDKMPSNLRKIFG